MQIGSCWFDMASGQLSNQENDTSWKMPVSEHAILSLLANHRGQVLSNAQLIAVLPVTESSQARLEEAIDRLRFFMGNNSASLIESIDDQGFLLHVKLARSHRFLNGTPGRSITKQQYLILIAQLILLLLLLYSVFEPSTKFSLHKEQQIHTSNGDVAYYPIYHSHDQQVVMAPQFEHLVTQLHQCQSFEWDKLFYSWSDDNKVMSIGLKKDSSTGLIVRNIKVIAQASSFDFIDQQWLVKMEICS
ncbi:winged helix-turn-helix domain-containing protein [Shewanella colwelliana]|uniref:winged helix-turn-helix domain-containing protein n=1 Tax=Shewanella colwelliana TaxID=23 RepID=UPI0022AED453|nr:helix-turn-helix domain-containing protein [Shewanella colwelliana]MCZ4339020.1 helix-turn-helix domain-containing protein [Shewanella colwelliana]